MKILVVDDMPSMRHVMMHMLTNLGYKNPDEASCGLQALKMLRLNNYDLLITDLHMPNLNGEQLLSKVRGDKKLCNLPVLMVSSEDDKAKIVELIASEVTGFMVKPFNLSTLKKQLHWIHSNRNIA
ncbi:response regulator [Colwellia sp. 12G3]|uniref:response regulator n=1 Tax=Colwellia sp. 12G3 TaxID=2058299 RepID=UPI000C33E910|nr:response regulator [Colwellia sp. 12G3]PKI14232.1 two-component system response regulator [Colwellia sp. 12G3]